MHHLLHAVAQTLLLVLVGIGAPLTLALMAAASEDLADRLRWARKCRAWDRTVRRERVQRTS